MFLGIDVDYSKILSKVDFSFGFMANSTLNAINAVFAIDPPTTSPTSTNPPSTTPTLTSMPTNVLQNVTLEINFDTYSSVSVSWRLARVDGKVIKEAPLGTYGPFDGDAITEEFALELGGTYLFTIHDNQGDGICCKTGEGHAAIYFGTNSSTDEVLLYDRGDFLYERSQFFTVSSNDTFVATQSPTAAPTSSNVPTTSISPSNAAMVDVIVVIQFDL